MSSLGGNKVATECDNVENSGRVISLLTEFEASIAHLSFDEVTRSALAFMSQRLGIARASVALLREDKQSFLLFDTTLDISGLESGKVVPLNSASLGATIEQRTAIYRSNVRQWPVSNAVDTALLAAGLQCTLSVPLSVANNMMGSLNAAAHDVDGIEPLMRRVIELLAPRLAFALHAGIAHDRTNESESRFRDVFGAVGDGIVVADVATRQIVMANPAICRMLQRSESELLQLTIEAIHPSDRIDDVLSTFVAMVDGQIDHALEIPMMRADGSSFSADVTARHTTLQSRQCVVGVFRDALLRLQREQEQVQVQKLDSIRNLAAGIAHDFNNLLTGLIGNMDLARTYLDAASEACELLAEAQRAAVRATTLTRQLLTFAKGGSPLRKVTDIVQLTRDSAELACRGSNVSCQFTLPDNKVHVMGDEGQLAQAIQNLVRNAVEAMPGGGIVQVELQVRFAPEVGKGNEVCITVTDHGCGIEPSKLDHIFLPFFTTKSNGNGLGLAVTYSVVQSHGGRIRVSSKLDEGTTFELSLSATEADEPEPRNEGTSITRGSGRVLVMDDQAVVRQVAANMLRKAGYDVYLAATGQEAIASYRDAMSRGQRFDAVILDLTVFGGMGGRDAAAALLAMDPNARLVVSSGYSEDGAMSDYAKHGFKAVLPKPYDSSQLTAALAQVLDARSNDIAN